MLVLCEPPSLCDWEEKLFWVCTYFSIQNFYILSQHRYLENIFRIFEPPLLHSRRAHLRTGLHTYRKFIYFSDKYGNGYIYILCYNITEISELQIVTKLLFMYHENSFVNYFLNPYTSTSHRRLLPNYFILSIELFFFPWTT